MSEPLWLVEGRKWLGVREIAGSMHEPRIVQALVKLGAWWRDDETPWCGVAVAYWMQEAGVIPPKAYYRAKAWADWGVHCEPQVGAVVVFERKGGGHVALIVGITAAGHLVCLGGNQGDQVSYAAFDASRMVACRWPAIMGPRGAVLPVLNANGLPLSTNEA